MPEISVVTVTWNSQGVIADCLDAVLGQVPAGGIDVIAVDNASTDDTIERLASFGRRVRLIRNSTNRGYARAVNQGIRASRGETVILLNPDTIAAADSLKGFTEYFSRYPSVGLVGGELVNPDGTRQDSVRRFPGYFDLAFRPTSPLSRFLPSLTGGRDSTQSDRTVAAGPVDSVAGAFMGIRRSMLEQTGLFDENYFMFVEDMDLCFRAWRVGWEVHYLPGIRACHHQGSSTRLRRRRMVTEHARSTYHFMTKHGEGGLTSRIFLTTGLCLYSLLGDVGRGKSQRNNRSRGP